MAKTEVFDSRFNLLGEGPTATGAKNELITWVDIHGKAVKWRNALTGEIGEFLTDEHVGFQIATKSGGHIL
ncbi:MAG: SMP-30/gluconolactonase/LRE family protein, partial [Actinomycetes bacterium]